MQGSLSRSGVIGAHPCLHPGNEQKPSHLACERVNDVTRVQARAQRLGPGERGQVLLVIRLQVGAQLDRAVVPLAKVVHEHRALALERRERHIVDAVVQDAHLLGGQRPGEARDGGAVDADSSKIARKLVGDETDAVAVELGVGRLGEHKRALPLAVGDDHAGPLELAQPRAGLLGQVTQDVGHLPHGIGERALDVAHQPRLRLEAGQELRQVAVVLERAAVLLEVGPSCHELTA